MKDRRSGLNSIPQFDYYAGHGAKISVIEPLLGQSGLLKLQRFSIAALERQAAHLLFAAITDQGETLPAETTNAN
ncbi:MAG: hypothetical protein PHW13_13660 [Methylococcales bacterium]|nr:hypothetical protein [Methylococcales bacterium]